MTNHRRRREGADAVFKPNFVKFLWKKNHDVIIG